MSVPKKLKKEFQKTLNTLNKIDIHHSNPNVKEFNIQKQTLYLYVLGSKIGKVNAIYRTNKESNFLNEKGYSYKDCNDIYFTKLYKKCFTQVPKDFMIYSKKRNELYLLIIDPTFIGLKACPSIKRELEVEPYMLMDYTPIPILDLINIKLQNLEKKVLSLQKQRDDIYNMAESFKDMKEKLSNEKEPITEESKNEVP